VQIDNPGYQCTVKWSNPGWFDHEAHNVIGIYRDPSSLPGVLLQSDADAIRDDFQAAWTSAGMAPFYPSGLKPVELTLRDVQQPPGGQAVFTSNITVTGTGSADALPAELAIVTKILVDVPGLRKRGRWYWPAPTEAANVNGVITGTFPTASVAFLVAWDGNINARAGYDGLGVISRKDSHINQANGFVTNTTWDSQRRRGLR